jgi:hypothetical protein
MLYVPAPKITSAQLGALPIVLCMVLVLMPLFRLMVGPPHPVGAGPVGPLLDGGPAVTVIPQGEAVRLPTWAHMFVVPAPTAVAMPLLLIEATCGALLVQAVTELPVASGSVATDPSE